MTIAATAVSLAQDDAAAPQPEDAVTSILLPAPSPVRPKDPARAAAVAEREVELPVRKLTVEAAAGVPPPSPSPVRPKAQVREAAITANPSQLQMPDPGDETSMPVPLPQRSPKGEMDEIQEPLINANPFELQVLELTNQARSRGAVCGGVRKPPARPLVWHNGLSRAARIWSRQLSRTGQLSHYRMTQRIRAVGIKVCAKRRTWGENVAYNASAKRVVAAWLRSPGHCKNIMNPRYGIMGVGLVRKGRRQYYTQLFHSAPGC